MKMLYIDMDNVLVDFPSAFSKINEDLLAVYDSRLDEVQAMVLNVRLARFAEEQSDRNQVGAIYDSYIPAANRLVDPNPGAGNHVTYHQYWVRTSRRAELQKLLDDNSFP